MLIYCSLIRSVLEYASVVFSNLPQYLSLALEKVQKRALTIIYATSFRYEQLLEMAGLMSLEARRERACCQFMRSIKPESVLYSLMNGRRVVNDTPYSLRSSVKYHIRHRRTDRFNNFVSLKYLSSLLVVSIALSVL